MLAQPRRGSTRPDTAVGLAPEQVEVEPREASEVLLGWDYADAFACDWPEADPHTTAMTVARALLGPPCSARRVLAGRDLVVRPLGLREAHQGDVLLFPVLEEETDRVVCGFDDRHLDFRVVVTLSSGIARCTTVVRRHGFSGRVYFALVGPVHRWLVPHLMRRGRTARRLRQVPLS